MRTGCPQKSFADRATYIKENVYEKKVPATQGREG